MKQGMSEEAKAWLKNRADGFLFEMGIGKNQHVLDFGCCEGNYTIPAARIVGERGRVYALDREPDYVTRTIMKAKTRGLENVVGIVPTSELEVPLGKNSVDAILAFDVLHPVYFPEKEGRGEILQGFYRILKKRGFLLVYFTHLEQHKMTLKQVIDEIESTGFLHERRYQKKLVSDRELKTGKILKFLKYETTKL